MKFDKIGWNSIFCLLLLSIVSGCGGGGGSGGKGGNQITIALANYDVKTYLGKFESASSPSWTFYNQYVSSFGMPAVYNQFTLTLQNLPWSSSQQVVYERYLVDDQHKLDLIETQTLPGANSLSFTKVITAPSVQIIRLYRKEVLQ